MASGLKDRKLFIQISYKPGEAIPAPNTLHSVNRLGDHRVKEYGIIYALNSQQFKSLKVEVFEVKYLI